MLLSFEATPLRLCGYSFQCEGFLAVQVGMAPTRPEGDLECETRKKECGKSRMPCPIGRKRAFAPEVLYDLNVTRLPSGSLNFGGHGLRRRRDVLTQ